MDCNFAQYSFWCTVWLRAQNWNEKWKMQRPNLETIVVNYYYIAYAVFLILTVFVYHMMQSIVSFFAKTKMKYDLCSVYSWMGLVIQLKRELYISEKQRTNYKYKV